jgi:hypothetical protein
MRRSTDSRIHARLRAFASALFCALFSAPFAACSHDCHCDGGSPQAPVFAESEPNDDPLTANDFGSLLPGDHFFIDGFVRDDLVDPFDGFQFTAAQALHVDFQLFSDNAATDLDVCLYDPQLDQTVACFATSDNPERGGVDVDAGGLAFQLVVESFVGDGPYSLEIDVQPLFAATAAGQPLAEAARAQIRGVDARAEHAVKAASGYAKRPAARPALLIEQVFDVDEARGLVLERVLVHPDARL